MIMSNPISHIQVQTQAISYVKSAQPNLGENQQVAANAVTSAKGHENDMTSDSKEAREKKRVAEAQRLKDKAARDQSKTMGSQRGFLA